MGRYRLFGAAAIVVLAGGGVALGLWGTDVFDGSDDTVDLVPEDVPDDGAMLDPLPGSPRHVASEDGIACTVPDEQGPAGCEGWVLDHEIEAVGPLVAHDGRRTAYVGGTEGLHAVELASGELRWSARRVGAVSARPVVGDGVLVVAAGDEVYGLHRDGRLRWSRTLGAGEDGQQLRPSGRPHLVDDLVLVPAQQEAVAIEANSGARAWRIDHRAAVVSVAASEGLVVVHFIDGATHAYDGGSGELVWDAPSRLVASDVALSARNGIVLVANGSREIAALRVDDGSLVWEGESDGRRVWAVERFGEVYVEAEGRLHVLDIHDGQRLRAFDPGGSVVEVSEHGWIHTLDDDAHEIAVHHPATGGTVWRATLPDEVEYVTSMDQLGDELGLGVVLGDGRLLHLVTPLVGPPLMHEMIRLDEGCPASPQQDRDFSPHHQQALIGDNVEIAGLGTSPSVPTETWILLTADPDDEDVLVRGRQVGGSGSMSFTDSQDAFRGEARTYGENLPPLVRVLPALDGPGCWAYQVDRSQVSDLLVFELSSEDYEKASPARADNP